MPFMIQWNLNFRFDLIRLRMDLFMFCFGVFLPFLPFSPCKMIISHQENNSTLSSACNRTKNAQSHVSLPWKFISVACNRTNTFLRTSRDRLTNAKTNTLTLNKIENRWFFFLIRSHCVYAIECFSFFAGLLFLYNLFTDRAENEIDLNYIQSST